MSTQIISVHASYKDAYSSERGWLKPEPRKRHRMRSYDTMHRHILPDIIRVIYKPKVQSAWVMNKTPRTLLPAEYWQALPSPRPISSIVCKCIYQSLLHYLAAAMISSSLSLKTISQIVHPLSGKPPQPQTDQTSPASSSWLPRQLKRKVIPPRSASFQEKPPPSPPPPNRGWRVLAFWTNSSTSR